MNMISSISRCAWQLTDKYITDILTDKQFTKTLSFTFCLFNDGCDGKSEALKATIYKGSIALIFFEPRLTVR